MKLQRMDMTIRLQWNWNAPISQQENMNRLHCQRECMRLYGFVSGNAEGHNWWCVIFPPMCLPAAEESQELEDVLDA